MSKNKPQIESEIRAIKSKSAEILKHLETLKKERIYDVTYIEKYINAIKDFDTKINGADGLKVRSENHFKSEKENKK